MKQVHRFLSQHPKKIAGLLITGLIGGFTQKIFELPGGTLGKKVDAWLKVIDPISILLSIILFLLIFIALLAVYSQHMRTNLIMSKKKRPDFQYFGNVETRWLCVSGDGLAAIPWKNAQCLVLDKRVDIPRSLHGEVKYWENQLPKEGKFNGEQLSIGRISGAPLDSKEEPCIHTEFVINTYAEYKAVNDTAKGLKVRKAGLMNWTDVNTLRSYLKMGVGINCALITADKKLVLGRRDPTVCAIRPNQYDIGAVEGLSKHLELKEAKAQGSFDLEDVFKRALWEEFRIERPEITKLDLLGVGYDYEWCQINFIGLAETSETFEEINNRQRRIEEKRREYEYLLGIPFQGSMSKLKSTLRGEDIWSCGLITLWLSLAFKRQNLRQVSQILSTFDIARFKELDIHH